MRSFLFVLLISGFVSLKSQSTIDSIYIGWRGESNALHTIGNKQQSCSFLMNSDSVKALLLNDDASVTPVFTVPRIFKEDFLGAFIKEGNLYLFLDNGNKSGIRSFLYNISSKKLTEQAIPFAITEEKILNRLSSNNYFFYFAVDKKTSEFVIYKFKDEKNYDAIRYAGPANLWKEISKGAGAFSTNKTNIDKADLEGECDIEIANSHNKIYVRNDTLLFLMDQGREATKVYSFDLTNNKTDYRFISHDNAIDDAKSVVYNSFLLRDKLYYGTACMDYLFLEVRDFYTGKSINYFKAPEEEEIGFKNTNITMEGSDILSYSKRGLEKTKQLLRKMVAGTIVITATPDDVNKQVVLLVGSYKEVTSVGGGGVWMPVSGGPVGGMTYIPTGGFSRSSWVKSARFKTVLNNSSFEHVSGEVPVSINDRIDDYTKGIKIPAEGENLYVLNGAYHYAFYDKKHRVFKLVRF